MEKLYETLMALYHLGATWTARRATRSAPYDTIVCTTLVQTDEGVVRGLTESQEFRRTVRAEIAVYIGGKLDDKGEFKHQSHSRAKTVKLYEYENTVPEGGKYWEGFFGLFHGFSPVATPQIDLYLQDFAYRLIQAADREEAESKTAKAAQESARKSANETRARKALFG